MINNTKTIVNVGEDLEKSELYWWECKRCSHFRKLAAPERIKHKSYHMHACSVTQSCLTRWEPKSLPGSSVQGVFQARILEWVAISYSRGPSRPRDGTHVSVSPALTGRFFTTVPPGKPHAGSIMGTDLIFSVWKIGFLSSLVISKLCDRGQTTSLSGSLLSPLKDQRVYLKFLKQSIHGIWE